MNYVIVKHAGSHWRDHWANNPKLGVSASCSAHDTHTGRTVGLKPMYSGDDLPLAVEHVKKINADNPAGDYALCPVK